MPLRGFDVATFDYHRVLTFLQARCWHRKASKIGVISFYYQRWFLSRSVADQWVSIRLDAAIHECVIFTANGELINAFPNVVITQNVLLNLPMSQSSDSESC